MTLSQLSPIVPESRRKPIELLASDLINGRATDSDNVLKAYNRQIIRSSRMKWYVAILIPLVLSAISVYLITDYLRSDSDGLPLSGKVEKSPVEEYSDDSLLLSNGQASTVNAEADPAQNEAGPGSYSDKVDGDENKKRLLDYAFVTSEEALPNEYGVAPAEARYLEIFRDNELDRYVIERTDNVVIELNAVYQNETASDDKRMKAYENFHSFEAISAIVSEEVFRKFANADRNRVLGLVMERMRVWRDSYDLMPSKIYLKMDSIRKSDL